MKKSKYIGLLAALLVLWSAVAPVKAADTGTAIFSGGCFWCVESDFDHVPGVTQTISGYTGGMTDSPTYETHHDGGHREAVKISFDPAVVSYAELVEIFWRSVDPTDGGGQFCDRGHSYTTAIYALDDEQLSIARQSRQSLEQSNILNAPVVTGIEFAGNFWPAEDYHQDFYKKSSLRYKYYRFGCGRDSRIRELWKDQAHRGIEDH